jgi:hypothetical protein
MGVVDHRHGLAAFITGKYGTIRLHWTEILMQSDHGYFLAKIKLLKKP